MSNYEDIYGKRVKELSADPTLNSSYEGQVWYNSTEGVLKSVVNFDAWSSASSMGSGRYAIAKGTLGTQTAAIAALGRSGGPSQDDTEEYNGTGWNTEGNANTARYASGGFGTTSAFVAAGGAPAQNTVEEYNGSSWTTVTSLPGTARTYLSGFGTESAGAALGGGTGSPDTVVTTTNEYDGSSWTSGGALNTGGSGCAATGTQTAATTATRTVLPFNTASGAAEQYDGSSWTTITSVNTSRYSAVGFGTKDDMTICGGVPNSTATEKWDGSSWTTSPATLATGRNRFGGAGASSGSGLAFAGNPPGVGTTEEFNNSINTIVNDSWSSGGALNTARRYISGCGSQTAAIGFGGFVPPTKGETELYDGTSWSEVNNLGTASYGKGAAGTSTAALAFGGSPDVCESWDGTNWTSIPSMNTGRRMFASCGIQTAALAMGGRSPEKSEVEEWNGTAWSEQNDLPTARRNQSGAGIQTAALSIGGYDGSNTLNSTLEYDGTNWTTGGNLNSAKYGMIQNSAGTQTASLTAGGNNDTFGITGETEQYDGTSWAITTSMTTARRQLGGAGTKTSALAFGGRLASAVSNATEEFTPGSTTVTSSTLTSS